ncbi:hypothetical protein BC941DRAFT_331772, partial [Chlamydoabsidia padenii]
MPTVHDSQLCKICLSEIEDVFHMVVSCTLRAQFWKEALRHYNVDPQDSFAIWATVTFQSMPQGKQARAQWFTRLAKWGRIMLIIWQYHWRTIYGNIP